MILYFANRTMEIMGRATTHLKNGFVITDDLKTEDVDTGVATFEGRIGFKASNRKRLEDMTKAGNYLLRKNDGEIEFYTIIEREIDTKNHEVMIYAEDAGLDLINEIATEFETTEAHPASWYVEKWIIDSGFEIGINEIPASSTRKLKWEGETTVTERLASIATQFGGYEISYSFEIKGMEITRKYVNIYKERGKDAGETLRLNKEIDRIITKETVANLATAFRCTGGIPEDAEEPITLVGYKYDDGDFYVAADGILRSRKAIEKWSRYVWNKEPNKLDGYSGHIIRTYSYDTLSQQTLCANAVTELKKICDVEINYEVDITTLPGNVKVGDRVNIVDSAGELFLSSRILKLERSVTQNSHTATIGEHLIKEGGISARIQEMADKFAESVNSAERAKAIADKAMVVAENAQTTANDALTESENANAKADEAQAAASDATQSAAQANAKADEAQSAVDTVEKSVDNLNTSVSNAQQVADEAKAAAANAETKATEAQTAAVNAQSKADEANTKAEEAQTAADGAAKSADGAMVTAVAAKTQANTATKTAEAAKADAEQAQKDVDSLGENLTTLESTMQAEYARKTELTETEASLQTQITQNAAGISSNASKIVTIDETANNAAEQAQAAQEAAEAAQAQADTATADAVKAQTAADEAAEAAQAAQNEADTAKAAAATARSVADKANTDLANAKADLATVSSRVDATETEIAEAEKAVQEAQTAADKANADAATAAAQAAAAQDTADTAKANAANAQSTANSAIAQAEAAQAAADAAQGDATAAQATADEAKAAAQAAQSTANTAKTNAANAQSKADAAAQEAAAAQTAADEAEAKAAAAQTDLDTAKSNLAAVTSRVDATETEIAEAEEAVANAQKAADDAAADAAAAQSTADTAKANAATAQAKANEAKTAADNAQKAADDAQDAADAAQAAVNALAVRVTKAETSITQNAEQIALRATKEEVTTTLGGYYTKTQTDAAIVAKANEITSSVSAIYTTKNEFKALEVGGTNLLLNSKFDTDFEHWSSGATIVSLDGVKCARIIGELAKTYTVNQNILSKLDTNDLTQEYVFSADVRIDDYVSGTTNPYVKLYFSGSDGSWLGATTVSGNPDIPTQAAGKWVRLSWVVKFTRKPTSMIAYVYARDFTGTLYFKDLKLEKGNRATDWSPAPEDIETEVTELSTRVTQTENSITSQATSISSLGSRMSTIEQTANGLTVELENLSVGGRNLVAGTSLDTVYSGNKGSSSYKDVWTGKTTDIPAGSEYVVSFDAKADVAQTITCYFYSPNTTTSAKSSTGQSSTSVDGSCNVTLTTGWKRYWVKWTQTAASTVKNIIVGRNTTANNIYIRAVKFEEGHTPSAWTPSPEDVDSDITTAQSTADTAKSNAAAAQTTANNAASAASTAQTTANTARTEAANAAKTATNFLSYDSTNGLLVGNKTSGSWSGSRAQILPTEFNILDASGNKLASYQANKIQLGLNSTESVIELCNGLGTISYSETYQLSDKRLVLASDRLALLGHEEVHLMSFDPNNPASDFSYICAIPGSVQMYSRYWTSEGTFTGSELTFSIIQFYALADKIHLVSRYGMTLDSVTGGITTVPRLYADGGLRLTNGGQVTGLTSSGTEITMLQMNASNYTMLGYGGYSNKIGRTYIDGNEIYMRSNGYVDLTGHLRINGNLTMVSNTATFSAIELTRATPYIDFHYGQSTADYTSRIIEQNSGDLRIIVTTSAILQLPSDAVGLYNSTNSSYTAHFRPKTDGKCTLGIAANRWYAVYAANSSIQTSDRREKENVSPLGLPYMNTNGNTVDLHSELFDRLEPVQYNFINGNKKICYGLIAQDVVLAMREVGISEDELDLVHHDFWTDEESGDTKESYGLAYTNLIAMLIHEVQKLKAEVALLKSA